MSPAEGQGHGRRGRPRGRTATGEQARRDLFEVAIALIQEKGYEHATLRDIAERAGVSPALLYRYFPSKRAVVLELYTELTARFVTQVRLPNGSWAERLPLALRASVGALSAHRSVLRSLLPVLLAGQEEGVLSVATESSRQAVLGVFRQAVLGASDAPEPAVAEALARASYLAHLAFILLWLLDGSPRARATRALLSAIEEGLPAARYALLLAPVRSALLQLDTQLVDALFREKKRRG